MPPASWAPQGRTTPKGRLGNSMEGLRGAADTEDTSGRRLVRMRGHPCPSLLFLSASWSGTALPTAAAPYK